MIQLFAYLFAYAAGLVILVALLRPGLRRRWGPRLQAARRRRQGIRNAHQMATHGDEMCVVCLGATDPQKGDIYDSPRRAWMHQTCFRELMGQLSTIPPRVEVNEDPSASEKK